MNKSRSAYLKVFPLVFLLALVITAMQLYREYHQQAFKDHSDLFEWSVVILQLSGFWVAVGLAFRQWKAALIALGVALAITFTEYFLYKSGLMKAAPVAVRYLYSILISIFFTPALVFALLCFRKQASSFSYLLYCLAVPS